MNCKSFSGMNSTANGEPWYGVLLSVEMDHFLSEHSFTTFFSCFVANEIAGFVENEKQKLKHTIRWFSFQHKIIVFVFINLVFRVYVLTVNIEMPTLSLYSIS